MVSAPSTPRRSTGAHHKRRDPVPAGLRRLAVGTLLAVPYLLVVLVNGAGGPNIELDRRGEQIEWGGSDLSFVRDLFPPLPVGLAGALPGGPVVLGVVGAILAAVACEFLIERLRRRGFRWWFSVPVVIGIAAMPVYGRTATTDLATFAGLVLLLLAIAGLLEFTVLGDTGGGFRAGLALGIGVACDLTVAVYALGIGVLAPLIARRRAPYATQAAMLVLLFPSCAALLGWAFLEWRFSGGAFHAVSLQPGGSVTTTLTALALSPVFLLSAAVLVRRNAAAAAALLIPVTGLMAGEMLGLSHGRGPAMIVLALIGAFTIAPDPSRTLARLYALAVVLQIGLASALA